MTSWLIWNKANWIGFRIPRPNIGCVLENGWKKPNVQEWETNINQSQDNKENKSTIYLDLNKLNVPFNWPEKDMHNVFNVWEKIAWAVL